MLRVRNQWPLRCVLALAGYLLILGGGQSTHAQETNPMLQAVSDASRTSGSIPPIDAAAPQKTKTATFALG